MTQNELIATAILIKLVMLSLATVLTHLTYQSYRRSGRREIRSLAIGFGSLALGIVLGSAVAWLGGTDLLAGLIVEGVLGSFGLGMVIYSLYGFE